MCSLEEKKAMIEAEIRKAIEDGAKQVDLGLLDSLDAIKINDFTKDEALYTIDLYKESLEQLKKLGPKYERVYLETARASDIIDNQALEAEDSFLISLCERLISEEAIDILIKNYGKEMTKDVLIETHDLLLEGTSSSEKKGLRTDDTKFVGTFVNGKRVVSYIPLKSEQIEEALTRLISYYNANLNNIENESDSMIKPIIYHGLIAGLQMFNDGNTRLGRLVQTVDMWGRLNKVADEKVELPLLYASRQYYPCRTEYRDLIKNLVLNTDQEAWNKWIIFNLRRFQEGLYLSNSHIEQVKKLKRD